MARQSNRSTLIFNIIKTVLLAGIAAALFKFAFFPAADAAEQQPLDPSAVYGEITVLPETGDIRNVINLEGTIQNDPAAAVKATKTGEVTEIYVADGQHVAAGETLLLIQKELPPLALDETAEQATAPPQPRYENAWVTSPIDGVVTLNVLLTQPVSVGESIASVQPGSFSAVANLTPDQMYRVQHLPEKATITIKNGPAPFECAGLRITTPQQRQQQPSQQESSPNTATTIEAKCAIASEHRVFPGLQVTMGLVAGEAQGVLTVPLTAVEGRFETGIVYTPNPGGDPQQLHVKLGITDGKRIEIVEGLTKEQEILEFVPGKQLEPGTKFGDYPGAGFGGDVEFGETGN